MLTQNKLSTMKKNCIILFITIGCLLLINRNYAQIASEQKSKTDPVLLIVGNDTVTKSEFLTVYKKNNIKKDVPIDQKALEEYLDLYINFKLKVKEAESLGMDTVSSFITELAGYRKQLAQPYLVNKDVNEKLLTEAYERMQWDIRASHILIKVSEDASEQDTLKAYKKIMEIRKRALKGEDFGDLAVENSEDNSARDQAATAQRPFIKGNKGDLGYFTALDLIYEFENAAYNTKVGEISMPTRTSFGYHIIKVVDRKPAMGKVQVAHILNTFPANATKEDSLKVKNKINEIYDSLKAGASFEDMAKNHSDDKASSAKGGILPWFGIWRMLPEFVSTLSDMKINDISKPVETMYGWHILKLMNRKPVGAFDSIKTELKSKITKDNRASLSKEIMVDSIKKQYHFKENIATLSDFYKIVDDSIFMGKWDINRAKDLNKVMFTLGDKKYTQQDFATYFSKNLTRKTTKEDSSMYVRKIYKQWVETSAIDYEDSKLESKYPDFKALMKEYRDGILLFELTDEKVWSKAVKDSTGLDAFYNSNKNNYMWDDRMDVTIYTCANEKISKATRKLVNKGKLNDNDILNTINKNSQLNLKIETGKFEKTDTTIKSIPWVVGISQDIKKGNSVVFANVKNIIPKEPKSLLEARGLITADYQSYLEKEWITDLKKKYPVIVNRDVLSTIK